jgi:hypothetical protein
MQLWKPTNQLAVSTSHLPCRWRIYVERSTKEHKTDLPVYIAEDPLRAVVEELEWLKNITNLRAF